MLGLVIATLVLVVLGLLVSVVSNVMVTERMERAISRQDERVRKRAERAGNSADEDNIGQLVDDLRSGNTFLPPKAAEEVADVLERHPEAKWPKGEPELPW